MLVDVVRVVGIRPGCPRAEGLELKDIVRGLWGQAGGPLADMMAPPWADVEKMESDQERGVFFWSTAAEGAICNFGSHVTLFTPHWCAAHSWSFDKACLACEADKTAPPPSL